MITYTGCTDIITSAYLPVVPCVQHVHLTTARHTYFQRTFVHISCDSQTFISIQNT